MKLTSSTKAALVFLLALVAYFGLRMIFSGPRAGEDEAQADAVFTVIAEPIEPQAWRDEVVIRGRTEALRKITVRAETSGVVEATPAEPGALVKEGDPLCKIRIDARRAGLEEARAALKKAQLDHDAAVELAKEGFRSETGVAAAKAARDLARANFEQAEVAVEKTVIAAPWAGVFDERMVETGDFMNIGDPCGVLIQQTPFLVVGAVSEKDVAKIKQGDRGVARLATGETVEGTIRVVGKAADPSTRTFTVELEVPNEAGALRDGVTAEFTVFADRTEAHLAPRSALVLDAEGRIGVRLVDNDDTVHFREVGLLGENADGVWISGIDGDARLIVRGQEFVGEGQKVAVAEEDGAGA